jgi:hypothetical protein
VFVFEAERGEIEGEVVLISLISGTSSRTARAISQPWCWTEADQSSKNLCSMISRTDSQVAELSEGNSA